MIAHAKGKYIRMSAVKMRQVVDLVRGKDVSASIFLLAHVEKKAKDSILKVLRSAISNAKQKGLAEDQLYISKITADGGPMWKRFRAASFGRATPILKRTAHLTIELDLKTK